MKTYQLSNIIWHCTFVKNGEKGHARAKYKVRNICKKKTIVKNVLLVSKTTLQHFLYRILTQFGYSISRKIRGISVAI